MKKLDKIENITNTEIPGLILIKRPTLPDERGYFREFVRLSDLEQLGIDFKPVQFSHSISLPGVIRAIHTEKVNKLVYPITGRMFAAYVDVRPDSNTFGKVVTMDFNNNDIPCGIAVYIPAGVGNSICAVGPDPVHYVYLIDKYWKAKGAQGIAWNDPNLAIDWPVKNPIISERDKNNPTMRKLYPDKFKGK